MFEIQKKERSGFSFIEMIIAVAIIGIVMAGVVLLISYATGSMRRTHNTVSLQNQTKDAILHMTTHLQESSDVEWDKDNKTMIVAKTKKDVYGNVSDIEVGYYWVDALTTTPVEGESDPSDDSERYEIYYNTKSFPEYVDVENPETHEKTRTLAEGESVEKYLKNDGSVDFDVLKLAYGDVKPTGDSLKSLVFVKDVYGDDGFDCVIKKKSMETVPVVEGEGGGTNPNSGEGEGEGEVTNSDSGEGESGGANSNPVGGEGGTLESNNTWVGGKVVVITLHLKNEFGDAEFTSKKEVYIRNQ